MEDTDAVTKNFVSDLVKSKAGTNYVNKELAKNASNTYVDNELANKADPSYVNRKVIDVTANYQKYVDSQIEKILAGTLPEMVTQTMKRVSENITCF